jgi:hypothetical protein
MEITYANESEASGHYTDKFGHFITGGPVALMTQEEANGVLCLLGTLKVEAGQEIVEFVMRRPSPNRFAVELTKWAAWKAAQEANT